jgi:2-polyprenyl-3-methyl-5-hydroxy-6-metoxy-1,4-benzoquinol methylase
MFTSQRRVVEEIMDGPNVEPSAHAEALAGLRRINAASKAAARMSIPIIRMARREKLDRFSTLDVACGGGDVSVGIANILSEAGIGVDLTLLDRSETALKLASETARAAGISAKTVRADLLDDWNPSSFDVVTCSLFLHHLLEADQVVKLLMRMRTIARRLVVISDLRRCDMGFAAAWIGSRVLSRSPIVHYDGPASVRAAWTVPELTDFALRAGMKDARIERCWPWRMLLIWDAAGKAS